MAEDVDAEFPCKRIKLDEDQSEDNSSAVLTTQTTDPVTEGENAPDIKEKESSGNKTEPVKENEATAEGEESDSDSSVSALSDLSGLSGEESWKGQGAGPMSWVYRNMEAGVSPRSILEQIIPDSSMIPDVDDFTLWKLVISIVNEPPPREKLDHINTIDDVLDLMKKCQKIIVLTGAGVSVSCGIPDFRSRNGVYARLAVDFPDLPDPQAMFDIHYFRNDQRPFFKFAKEIFPGQFEPSKCHKFIKLIEAHGKLLRNYTQNIDTLEQVAGIENVIQCHGSFATASCMVCGYKCAGDAIKEQIMNQVIPKCPKCDPVTPASVLKPDIVFFGESLPEEFHQQMAQDKELCDLLIVIGSSLKVRPVALIPNSLPANVPQILINKEQLRGLNFDVELLGDCDKIISELCRKLGNGWESLANQLEPLTQVSVDQLLTPPATPTATSSDSASKNTISLGQKERKDDLCKKDDSSKPSDKTSTGTDSNVVDTTTTSDNDQDKCLGKTDRVVSQQDTKGKKPTSMQASSSSADVGDKVVSSSAEAKSTTGEHEQTCESVSTAPCADKAVSSTVPDSVTDASLHDKDQASCNWNSNSVDETPERKLEAVGIKGDKSGGVVKTTDKTAAIDTEGCLREQQPDTSAGTSAKPTDQAATWPPRVTKISVAQRLGPNQYCLISPHTYIFSEAEVFTVVEGESDWEDMYSSDSDVDVNDDADDDDADADKGKESENAANTVDNKHGESKSANMDNKDEGISSSTETKPDMLAQPSETGTESESNKDQITTPSSTIENVVMASSETLSEQSADIADQA